MLGLVLLWVVFQFCAWIHAEVFTAISEVETLLKTRKRIIDDLDIHIEKEEQTLLILKRYLTLYRQEHIKAMENVPNYLANPVNAFTLIKRLSADLNLIEDVTGYKIVKHEDVQYPTLEDLTGAAQALTRLQDTYRLHVSELAHGILNGVQYSSPMTVDDCFELGHSQYMDKKYKIALEWMLEALRKYEELDEVGRTSLPYTDTDIIEYIGYLHYLLGNTKSSLKWMTKLMEAEELAEERKLPQRNLAGIRQHFKLEVTEEQKPTAKFSVWSISNSTKYGRLCRGKMDVSPDISKRLKCWYSSEHHPFLKYAPFKVEQMFIEPDIFVFHEVLSDEEIEVIKSIAKPKLKRAVVFDIDAGGLIPSQNRISKSAWLGDEESPVIARITRRISDMTGLDTESAERLQVGNYGIGGYYQEHYDFAQKADGPIPTSGGNRIATVLFYMSDVAQGGATVFLELSLSLFPIKRAAAFWLNLHPSGEGDMATLHAACPVLRGSKWVCNKWLHQGGQELIKPCTLEYQAEGIYRKLP